MLAEARRGFDDGGTRSFLWVGRQALGLGLVQGALGVAEAFGIDAELVEHADVEVGHGGGFAEVVVASRLEGAAAISGEDDGNVAVAVTVGVRDGAAVDNHGIVKEALAVDIFGVLEFVEEVSELLHVEAVDLGDLVEVHLLVLVVGDAVVPVGDADVFEAAVAAFVLEHHGGDAGGVGFEGEDHHVEEEAVAVALTGLGGTCVAEFQRDLRPWGPGG